MMNLQTPLQPTSSPAARRGTGRRRQRRKPSSTREPEAEHGQPDALARILRTEAAVSGVSRKAAAARQQSTNLWPRAVLEALDTAVAACRWESALEVASLPTLSPFFSPQRRLPLSCFACR
jgi:hypothetical protein